MKGYAGREAPKTSTEQLNVAPARESIADAIKQADLLQRLAQKMGMRFARLDPLRFGPNWMAYDDNTGEIKALFQVDALFYKFRDHESHTYPLAPFLGVGVNYLGAKKVGLIIEFEDVVATWSLGRAIGDGGLADLTIVAGTTIAAAQSGGGVPNPMIVIPSKAFRIVEEVKK